MGQRVGSFLRKSRYKLKLDYKEKGKISLSKYFQEFKDGDTIGLVIHPGVQKGRFYPRFHGQTGTISGKRGNCYGIKFTDGNKEKKLFVHPIHLKRL